MYKKKYIRVKTVEEAVRMAQECAGNSSGECAGDFSFISGGTDVIVNKFQGNDSSDCFIDVSGVEEMKGVREVEAHLIIGAGIRLDDLKNYTTIVKYFPMLLEAAHAVASPVIRKSATIGGNLLCENRCVFYNQSEWWREAVGLCLKCDGDICIATGGKKKCFSKFVSDMAVALISLDARIEVVEPGKTYLEKLEDIFTGDGIRHHRLGKTALIKAIHIPIKGECHSVFNKLRQRESMDFGSLTTAVTLHASGKIKIVLGCIDPRPIIVEGSLGANGEGAEKLILQATKKSRIIDNDVFSREYRKEMIVVYLKRSFEKLR